MKIETRHSYFFPRFFSYRNDTIRGEKKVEAFFICSCFSSQEKQHENTSSNNIKLIIHNHKYALRLFVLSFLFLHDYNDDKQVFREKMSFLALHRRM